MHTNSVASMCSLEQIVGVSNSMLTGEMQKFACDQCSDENSTMQYNINVASMDSIVALSQVDDESQRKGTNDAGAIVSIIPHRLVIQLGMANQPHTDSRMIGNAHIKGGLIIEGWLDVGGYIGVMAVVIKATRMLFA